MCYTKSSLNVDASETILHVSNHPGIGAEGRIQHLYNCSTSSACKTGCQVVTYVILGKLKFSPHMVFEESHMDSV